MTEVASRENREGWCRLTPWVRIASPILILPPQGVTVAKLDCNYFPDLPASWLCNQCNAQYSEKCIPAGHSQHWGRRGPACVLCNHELLYLGSATGAKPFWQMLPHFFLYPLHTNSLIVITSLAAGSLLLGGGLLTLFLVLFGLAAMIKYSFAIIEQRGQGETTPPSLGAVLTGDEHHLFLKQIAVLFILGVVIGLAYQLGEVIGILVGGFITLAIPASTVLLAVEKSVARALNPFAQLSLMTAIGWPYLLLWVCVQIVSAGPYYSFDILLRLLPDIWVMPVLVAIVVYFTFVLYAMLGYVLFEYQHELGFESVGDEDEMDAHAFEKAKALGETTVLLKEGDYVRARSSLRRALDIVRDDLELHQRYHKLLMLLDDDAALVNHAAFFIEIANKQQSLNKAVAILLDVQTRVPAFQLEDTRLALALAELLQQQRQYKAIVRLFHNLHKTKPQDPHLPAAYLLVAKTFFEFLNDDAKAKSLVDFMVKKYPNSALQAHFLQLRQAIEKHMQSIQNISQ